MEPLILWQNIPSIHQAPLVRSLAQRWNGTITVVAENDVSARRLQQGWSRPEFAPAELLIQPTRSERQAVLQRAGDDAIHIFSGFHAFPETWWTFRQSARTKALIGVFAEPINLAGFKGPFKRPLYTMHALRWRQRLDFMLVTGERGLRWYASCGFQPEKLYPFGYFTEIMEDNFEMHNKLPDGGSSRLKLLFVGQLMPRKGIDLLIHSISQLQNHTWSLTIIGQGAYEHEYRTLCHQLGIAERVEWLGSLPNQKVRKHMLASDYLILPSRFDGWGAVVNEALTEGTPVLVSDGCGASDLVRESWRGRVVRADSIEALRQALTEIMISGPVTNLQRQRIRTWARERISPETAAGYLIDIITALRTASSTPKAPWLLPDCELAESHTCV